ncbi:hypothetical protein Taro_000216, partial [Colocasia esculenta]|nr:hypothetical protein [Colocasia esculenta]
LVPGFLCYYCSYLETVAIAGVVSSVGLVPSGPLLLSTGTHRARKPELCLLLAVDSPSWLSTVSSLFPTIFRMDMNAQERLDAVMEMLRQDIELYAQAQRESYMQIKEEVLNLTAGAFMAGNPCTSLEIMSQVMMNLDNLKLGQDLLLHQVEGHWEALTDAARELYHGAGEKKVNEFAGLKQLRMSVSEYEAQFAWLSKYAPHLISTEKLKAKRFMNGLRPHFITQLTPHLITTYSEMVKRALALEATNETVDKIRGKSGEGSSDRKRKYESGNAPKVQQAAKKAGKASVGTLVPGFFCYYCSYLETVAIAGVVSSAGLVPSATCRQPAQSFRQAHAVQNSRFLDSVDLSTGPMLLSTGTHRDRKPELCLLLAVDSPSWLSTGNTDGGDA